MCNKSSNLLLNWLVIEIWLINLKKKKKIGLNEEENVCCSLREPVGIICRCNNENDY